MHKLLCPEGDSPRAEATCFSLLITQLHVHYVGITITYIITSPFLHLIHLRTSHLSLSLSLSYTKGATNNPVRHIYTNPSNATLPPPPPAQTCSKQGAIWGKHPNYLIGKPRHWVNHARIYLNHHNNRELTYKNNIIQATGPAYTWKKT